MDYLKSIKKNLQSDKKEFIDKYSCFLQNHQRFASSKKLEEPLENNTTNIVLFRQIFTELSNAENGNDSQEENSYSIVDLYEEIKELITYLEKNEIEQIEYSLISKIVVDIKDEDGYDEHGMLSDFMDNFIVASRNQLLEFIKNCEKHQEIKRYQKYILCFYKVLEHTSLANMQFNELYMKSMEQILSLDKSLTKMSQQLVDRKNSLDSLVTETDDLRKKYSSMNVEIISVLGIFSAIVFVIFSSFFGVVKILEGLQTNEMSILRTLITSTIMMSFLITILYSLLYWVSLIIEKPILKNCTKCEDKCLSPIHICQRHGFYLLIIFICALVFCVSIYLLKK